MLSREVLRQVRRLRLKARKAVESALGGEYRSVFKGAGIAFEEVRPYQPGDDVRAIDWNVTARMDQPFLKRFIEERERTVLLAADVSRSMAFGTSRRSKRQAMAELAGVLAFCAAANNDRVGLMLFSDRIEHYLPAAKGPRHVLRLIYDAFDFKPTSTATSLATGLDQLNRVLRRRAIVFLFSDFFGRDYEQALRRTARRHELIAVRLSDPRERDLPNVGWVELEDAETGQRVLIDTSDPAVRAAYQETASERREAVTRCLRGAGVDVIESAGDDGHLAALERFFRLRREGRA